MSERDEGLIGLDTRNYHLAGLGGCGKVKGCNRFLTGCNVGCLDCNLATRLQSKRSLGCNLVAGVLEGGFPPRVGELEGGVPPPEKNMCLA